MRLKTLSIYQKNQMVVGDRVACLYTFVMEDLESHAYYLLGVKHSFLNKAPYNMDEQIDISMAGASVDTDEYKISQKCEYSPALHVTVLEEVRTRLNLDRFCLLSSERCYTARAKEQSKYCYRLLVREGKSEYNKHYEVFVEITGCESNYNLKESRITHIKTFKSLQSYMSQSATAPILSYEQSLVHGYIQRMIHVNSPIEECLKVRCDDVQSNTVKTTDLRNFQGMLC